MGLIIALIIIWLLLPVILGVVCIVQHSRIKQLDMQLKQAMLNRNTENQNTSEVHSGADYSQMYAEPQAPPVHEAAPEAAAESVPAAVEQSVPSEPVIQNAQTVQTDIPAPETVQNVSGPVNPASQNVNPAPQRNSADMSYAAAYASMNKGTYHAAPNAAPQQAYRPAPAVPVQQPVSKPKSSANALLILGSVLISLVGFIFAGIAWDLMGAAARIVMLLMFSAVFFGIHFVADKKLNLEKTGRVFFVLGTVFLPAAVFAGAVLGVFGDDFSKPLIASVMFILTSAALFVGAHKYSDKNWARIAYTALSAAASAFLLFIFGSSGVYALTMAIISAALLFGQPFISKALNDNVIPSQLGWAVQVNTLIMGVMSVICAGSGVLALISLMIFALCFPFRFGKKGGGLGAAPFTIFAAAALIRGFEPVGYSGYAMTGAAFALLHAVLSWTGFLPEKARKLMGYVGLGIACICACSGVIWGIGGISDTVYTDSEKIYICAASVLTLVQLIVMAAREQNIVSKAAVFIGISAASAQIIGMYLTSADLVFIFVPCLVYLVLISATPLKKRLYSPVCTAMYCAAAVLAALTGMYESDTFGYGLICSAAFLSAAVVFAFASRSDSEFAAFSGAASAVVTAVSTVFIGEAFERARFSAESLFFGEELTSASVFAYAVTSVILIGCIFALFSVLRPGLYRLKAPYMILLTVGELPAVYSCFVDNMPLRAALIGIVLVFAVWFMKVRESRKAAFALLSSIEMFLFVGISSNEFAAVLAAWGILAVGAAVMYTSSVPSASKAAKIMGTWLSAAAPAMGALLFIFGLADFRSLDEGRLMLIISAAAVTAVAAVICIAEKKSLHMYPAMILFLFVLEDIIDDTVPMITAVCCAAAVYAVVGRLVFNDRSVYSKQLSCSDFFSVSALFAPFVVYDNSGTLGEWLSVMMFAALFANLARRGNSDKTNRVIFTVASAFIPILFIATPFRELGIDFPDYMYEEYNIIGIIIFCAIIRLIYRGTPAAANGFNFAAGILCTLILVTSSLSTGYNFDAVSAGIFSAAVLGSSFIVRKRRWFYLGGTGLAAEAILFSLLHTSGISWLIYLLITGGLLITAGIKGELRQRDPNTDKKQNFMSEWDW